MSSLLLKKGSYLAVQLTGCTGKYIGQVIEEKPLKLKVQEDGPCSYLEIEDFIIDEDLSILFQRDNDDEIARLLRSSKERGHPFISGLRSLGVTDDKLHEMLPAD